MHKIKNMRELSAEKARLTQLSNALAGSAKNNWKELLSAARPLALAKALLKGWVNK